jgi:hypothetical protein
VAALEEAAEPRSVDGVGGAGASAARPEPAGWRSAGKQSPSAMISQSCQPSPIKAVSTGTSTLLGQRQLPAGSKMILWPVASMPARIAEQSTTPRRRR